MDTATFDARYDELFADLARVCRAVGAGHRAEDVAQEALLYGRERIHGLRDDSKLVPWLRRIAVRAANRERAPLGTGPGVAVFVDRSVDLAIDERRALGKLPLRQRQLVTLVYLAGYRQGEAADMLGLSRGTVAKALWRARCGLARSLADYETGGVR